MCKPSEFSIEAFSAVRIFADGLEKIIQQQCGPKPVKVCIDTNFCPEVGSDVWTGKFVVWVYPDVTFPSAHARMCRKDAEIRRFVTVDVIKDDIYTVKGRVDLTPGLDPWE